MPGYTEVENRILQKYISDPKLSNSLALIRGVMESIWANDAPRIVQNYTDHGIEHSERIAYFVEKLLQVNPDAEFSEQEIYLLLAGVYLHDIGMQCDVVEYPDVKKRAENLGAKFGVAFTAETTNGYSPEEQNEIRKNHHYLSAAWIDYLYESNDSVLSPWIKSVPDYLVDDLMDVCKFHSKLPIDDCLTSFICDPRGRKKLVASLLRFADELDVDSRRVRIESVKIFSIASDNSVYWWLHNYTKVFIDSNKLLLTIRLHPEDFKLYGSLVREEFISNFKKKNQPVLEVLIEHKIPLVIDGNSDVIEYARAEKFPPEITAVLDKKIQESDLSPNSHIQVIGKNSGSEHPKNKGPKSNVPYSRNPFFTGREEKLEQIHEALLSNKTVALSQPVAVCGLGGIGKTQTAIEYTYCYNDEYKFILWVKADSDDSIISDFVSVAKILDLPVKDDSDQNLVVSVVKNWLRTNEGWLLVLDNADDPQVVENFLPPNPQGHILLTSRAQVFDNLGITNPIEIEKMLPEEAKDFFIRRTGRQNLDVSEIDALEELIQELDYLPLAIEQAGAYIHRMKSSFVEYLSSYRKRGLELLEKSKVSAGKYLKSVATTWLLNFEQIDKSSKASADILFVSAFLNCNKIPFEIFIKGYRELGENLSSALFEAEADPLIFREVMEPLGQFSLIYTDYDKSTYDIHRLVQTVLKVQMDENTHKLWIERIIKAVNRAFPEVKYENWELCDKLLPHAQTCAEYIELWDIETEEAAELLNEISKYLYERARFEECELFLNRALNIRKIIFDPDHPDLAESLNDLAVLYKSQGRYSDAEPLYNRALVIREKILGSEHPDVATSLNNLALLYNSQGKYSDAEPLYNRALAIREKILGSEHPDVATSLNNLAALYDTQGRHSDAEPLFKRALAIKEKVLGSEHPEVATSLNNLAALYTLWGKNLKAKELFVRSINIMEKSKGEDHPDFLRLLENYAQLLIKMRKGREASKILKRVEYIRAKNKKKS
ncbi:FxSxx-COOH system tetratricopeptide repeat protein [Methanosarcina sp. Mfa9]|uniref:FxSxx-COOH system tetratricopeptide repeat protein n=1 Tax=Methanosarcina sp. Mfa9 TaxID=3439063 RepID=UPI003F828AF4